MKKKFFIVSVLVFLIIACMSPIASAYESNLLFRETGNVLELSPQYYKDNHLYFVRAGNDYPLLYSYNLETKLAELVPLDIWTNFSTYIHVKNGKALYLDSNCEWALWDLNTSQKLDFSASTYWEYGFVQDPYLTENSVVWQEPDFDNNRLNVYRYDIPTATISLIYTIENTTREAVTDASDEYFLIGPEIIIKIGESEPTYTLNSGETYIGIKNNKLIYSDGSYYFYDLITKDRDKFINKADFELEEATSFTVWLDDDEIYGDLATAFVEYWLDFSLLTTRLYLCNVETGEKVLLADDLYLSGPSLYSSDNKFFYSLDWYNGTMDIYEMTLAISGKDAVSAISKIDPSTQDKTSLVADPVDSSSGAHILERKVLTVHGAMPIEFKLRYNSLLLEEGALGKGWEHNFDTKLDLLSDNNIDIRWSANRKNHFLNNGDGTYSSKDLSTINDKLKKNLDGSYTLTRKDQSFYHFNEQGQLLEQGNGHGQSLVFAYDIDGRLVTITEPISGRSFILEYGKDNGLISMVTDDLNRQVSFN